MKQKIKQLTIAGGLFMCFFPVIVNAQNKIEGKIIDKESKDPVSYVTVFCEKENTGTVSNSEGLFTLNLADTKNPVKISCIGYGYAEKTLTDGEIIELAPVVYELEAVTVVPINVKDVLSKIIENYNFNTHSNTVDYIVNIREFQQADNEYLKAVDAMGRMSIPGNRDISKISQFKFEATSSKIYLADDCFNTSIKTLFSMYSIPLRCVKYLKKYSRKVDIRVKSFYWDDRLVYEINFDSMNKNTKNKHKGYLYVDAETYAIQRIKIMQDKTVYKPSTTVYKGQKLTDQSKQAEMDIAYSKIDGKYNLSFFIFKDEFSIGKIQFCYNYSMSFSNLPSSSSKERGIYIDPNKDLYTQLKNSGLSVNTSTNGIMPTNEELKFWGKSNE